MLSKDETGMIISLYKEGYTTPECVKITGRTKTTCRRVAKLNRLEVVSCRDRILRDTDAIIESYKSGLTVKECSKKFHCRLQRISEILNKNEVSIRGSRKHTVNHNFFSNIITEYPAYWLGFIGADGYINKRGSTLSIDLHSDDIGHLKKFRDHLNADYPIYSPVNRSTNSLTVSSSQIILDLYSYGIVNRKSFIFTPTLESLPNGLERHFWRGMLDGDGNISKSRRDMCVRLYGSENSVLLFKSFLEKHIDVGNGSIAKAQTIYVFASYKHTVCYDILDLLYSNSNIYLDRKFDIVMNFLSIEPKKDALPSDLSREMLCDLYRKFGTWTKVASYFGVNVSYISRIKNGIRGNLGKFTCD